MELTSRYPCRSTSRLDAWPGRRLPWRLGVLPTLCAMLLFVGCQPGTLQRSGQPSVSPVPASLSDLVAYGNRLRTLTSGELESELRILREDADRGDTPDGVIKLALLLSTPQARFYNESSALDLLEGLLTADAGEGTSSDLLDFARLISSLTSEALARLEQKKAELRRVQSRLQAARAEAAELRRKLEALHQLEQQINRRAVD